MSRSCPHCKSIAPDDSKFCIHCGTKIEDNFTLPSQTNLAIEKHNSTIEVTKTNDIKRSKQTRNILIVIAILLLVIIFYQYESINNKNEKITALENDLIENSDLIELQADIILDNENTINQQDKEIADIQYENWDLEIEADFLEERIAFVPVGSSYYHRYGCSLIEGNYHAYNIELAIYKGYHPCGNCY